jgi:hypothetical protein|nr:MAG TPA: hypothetical protein [Caudoviricetes sp.]
MEVVEFADKLPVEVKNVMVDLTIIIWTIIIVILYWECKNDINNRFKNL